MPPSHGQHTGSERAQRGQHVPCISLSLCVSFSVSRSLCLVLRLSRSVSLSLSIAPCLSPLVSRSLSLALCLSVSPAVSVCAPRPPDAERVLYIPRRTSRWPPGFVRGATWRTPPCCSARPAWSAWAQSRLQSCPLCSLQGPTSASCPVQITTNGGNVIRVGTFLDFISSSARTTHPHGTASCVRAGGRAKSNGPPLGYN